MHLKASKSPGQTVRCWYSLKRGAPIYLPTVNHPQRGAAFYRPLRATAFHRISVQVISHQWVGQHHPTTLFQSVRCPKARHLARGERIVTSLYPNGSPARRGIEFHDSPRPRSILEPSSGGRKSGCQRSQRSFAR